MAAMNPVDIFFDPGAVVSALPGWSRPRLYATGRGVGERWRNADLYPGYKFRGRVFRVGMRMMAALGLTSRSEARDKAPAESVVASLLRDVHESQIPEGSKVAAVLIGTPGPAQKITVQIRDQHGRIVAYGKYGDGEMAIASLQAEHRMLAALPEGAGPKIIRFAPLADGRILLTSPVDGDPVGTKLPPDNAVLEYLQRMVVGDALALDEHPFIQDLCAKFPHAASVMRPLEGQRWPRAIQHGDFAPWNVKRVGSTVRAFDWEYGTVDGFPGLDLAFFWLQTQALINECEPQHAFEAAVGGVARAQFQGDVAVAKSIVQIATIDAFLKARAYGHTDDEPLQSWRATIVPQLKHAGESQSITRPANLA